ncbi:unnamed protein product, partial [Phaeothamnion confervicola]
LDSRLATASELFNDCAYPYCLFECCLALLASCGSDEPSLVAQLWTSLIFRETPRPIQYGAGTASAADAWLHEVAVALAAAKIGAAASFVDSGWLRAACVRVAAAIASLPGPGRDLVLPLPLIVEELEGLA